MRRALSAAALAVLLFAPSPARADQPWLTNNRAAGFQLDGLHAPQTSKDPATAALRLGDVAVCAGIPWSIGVNGAFRCTVGADLLTLVPVFVASGVSHAVGLVPDPGASAGTTRYLREDATWQPVPAAGITALVGGVTGTGPGSTTATVHLDAGGTVVGLLPLSNITPSGTNTWVLTTTGGVAVWAPPSVSGITQLTGPITAGPGSGSQASTLAFVPDETPFLGDILLTARATPATPASGHGYCWFDSTGRDWTCADQFGVQTHGVQTAFVSSGTFINGIGPDGVISRAGVNATQVAGLWPVALTGNGSDLNPASTPLDRLSQSGASGGQVASWNGSAWVPSTPSAGGITQLTGVLLAGPGSGSQAGTIANNAVTNAMLNQAPAHTLKGNSGNSPANVADLTLLEPLESATGNLFVHIDNSTLTLLSGTTLQVGAIPESKVTNLVTDLAARVPTARVLTMTAPMTCDGAGSCDLSSDRTIATPVFAGSTAGLVPPSSGGTTNFLRADGTYAVPPGTGGGGTVLPAGEIGFGTGSGVTSSPMLTYGSGFLNLGDGVTAQPRFIQTSGGLSTTTEWWLDATPTKASAIGNGVPGLSASTPDWYLSTFDGVGWSERLRVVNGGSLRVASLSTGGAAQCVQADSLGELSITGAACGGGGGGSVTDVSATSPMVSSHGATPNISLPVTSGQAVYGTGASVTSDPAFTYVTGGDDALTVLGNGATGSTSSLFVIANGGSGFFRSYGSTFGVASLANHVAFGNDSASGSAGVVIFGNDFSTSGGSGSVSIRGGGYDTAAEMLLIDSTGSTFTHGDVTVANTLTVGTAVASSPSGKFSLQYQGSTEMHLDTTDALTGGTTSVYVGGGFLTQIGENFNNPYITVAGGTPGQITLNTINSSVASATSATLNALVIGGNTTITGTTSITTAGGFNTTRFLAPVYSDSGAVTVSNAATVKIDGPPGTGGTVTITNPYALWIGGGITRLAGRIQQDNDSASAVSNLTFGVHGNVQFITGGGTINTIDTTAFAEGSIVTMFFDAATTVVHGHSATPPFATIALVGAVNASMPLFSKMQIILHAGQWWELSRSN